MDKKEAVHEMINFKKVTHVSRNEGWWMEYDNGFVTWSGECIDINIFEEEGFDIYEEPAKHIDYPVWSGEGDGLQCNEHGLSEVIGKQIVMHDTRYFATCYIINDLACGGPVMEIGETSTFASHVRFVREDLLRGIPK